MKYQKLLFTLFFLLFSFSGLILNAQYCESMGNNSSAEWIENIQVGCISSVSANNSGYALNESFSEFSLQYGATFSVVLNPGYSSTQWFENWAIYIDLNSDQDFLDDGELLFTANGENELNGTFSLPDFGSIGPSRMRIIMSYNPILGPCGNISLGEVEDYSINMIEKGNGLGSYCFTSGVSEEEWISTVFFNEVGVYTGNNCGFAEMSHLTFQLQKDLPVNVSLTPGYSGTEWGELWKIYLDANSDGFFSEEEVVFVSDGPSPEAVTGSFMLPASILPGTYRTRVFMSWGNFINGSCPEVNSFTGEAEDYMVNVFEVIPDPVAAFSFNPVNGNAPLQVQFLNASQNADFYDWEFNGPDASPSFSNDVNPLVLFNSPGTYEVSLTAYNSVAVHATVSTIVVNEAIVAPVTDFYVSNTELIEGESLTFTNVSTNNPTSFNWNFAGGTPETVSGPGPHSIQFNTAGTYSVSLTTSNSAGSDTETKSNYITVNPMNLPPEAIFLVNQSEIQPNSSVIFTSQSSNNPSAYSWSFPGGVPSSANTAGPHVIAYTNPGSYDVSLTVTNPAGTDTENKTGFVTVVQPILEPIADFTVNNATTQIGTAVLISSISQNEPTTYQWAFPGGNPATANTAGPHLVSYSNPGTYDVSLLVSNEVGSDLITKNAFITVDGTGNTAIEELLIQRAYVYPNPTAGQINLVGLVLSRSHFDYEISDINGKIVAFGKEQYVADKIYQFDLSDQSQGLYFLKIESGEQKQNLKVILGR